MAGNGNDTIQFGPTKNRLIYDIYLQNKNVLDDLDFIYNTFIGGEMLHFSKNTLDNIILTETEGNDYLKDILTQIKDIVESGLGSESGGAGTRKRRVKKRLTKSRKGVKKSRKSMKKRR